MSPRTIVVVFLALVSGAGMAVGVLQSNRPRSTAVVASTETEPVLVALVGFERGKMVTEEDVEVRQWPKGLAPGSALRAVEDAVERVAVGQVLKGELILGPKLAPKDAGRGLAALIPPGMRAFTVMTSRVASNVAGFVLPGNKVDVLLNLKGGGRGDDTGGGSTTTLLQAVEVLAVDQRLEAPAENKVDTKNLTSVTLLVTPEEANLLDLGQNMGALTLALRNPSDGSDQIVEPATVANVRFRNLPPKSPLPFLDGDAPPPELLSALSSPPAVRREPLAIVTLRGNHRGRVTLTGSNIEGTKSCGF